MEEGFSKSIIVKLGIAILIITLIDLFFLNYLVIKNQTQGNQQTDLQTSEERSVDLPSPSPVGLQSPNVVPASEKTIETKTVVEKETTTVVQTAQKEIFIPLGSGSFKSKTWANIPGLEVNIDTDKYSDIESIIFEATIWPEGGNGRAYARLTNVTDNNPLAESVISSSSFSGEFKSSGKVPFPSGSRKYGVQVKSDIENFPANVENSRVKITLK